MFDRRLLRQFDISLPLIALFLIIIGLVMISSATHIQRANGWSDLVQRQVVSAIIGFVLLFTVTFFIDYRIFKDYAYLFYAGSIALLILNLVTSGPGVTAQRTLFIGPINFQPSELAKLGLIMILAYLIAGEENKFSWLTIGKAFIVTAISFVLILRSDLGTALVLWFIFIIALYIGGLPGFYIFVMTGTTLGCLILWIILHLTFGVWIPLKEYQLMRLLVFWNPNIDPFGYGYHLIQSMIAIGSGGVMGKGLYAGTQTRLDFLPEQHTDFIFSVLGEELGFLGGAIVIILYCLLVLKGLLIAAKAKDKFGTLLAAGITAMFAFHIIVNVGMTMGILPITGIPLSFVSYGGSSLTTNLLAVGILLNINMRRQKLRF